MMKKRVMSILLVSALTLLTGCGGHTHSAQGGWEVNAKEHWQVCECGETVNTAAHTLDENNLCTVCGSEVTVWEDGSGQVMVYNENGDLIRIIYYAADGSVEAEETYEYEYDADGNITLETNYRNGALAAQLEYALNDAGERYIVRSGNCFEDGSKDTTEYDEAENVTYSAYYNADGSVEFAYAYEYNEDASWISEKEYFGEKLVAERTYAVDGDGVQQRLTEVLYNEDGSWVGTEYDLYENAVIEICSDKDGNVTLDRRYEYTYNENGSRTMAKTYENGVLVEEVEYFSGSDEEGSWEMSGKTTTYHSDGSKTVYDRDLEGTWTSEITYDAAGNVVNELRYEYEYDDDGDQVSGKGYENGRLIEESQAIVDESGETTGILLITYDEDGTKTVREYDANFDEVSETVYDAAGNEIPQS